MARKNVPFVDGVEHVSIPEGKRVTAVDVVEFDGRESVQIKVEDVPVLPPAVLASVTVAR